MTHKRKDWIVVIGLATRQHGEVPGNLSIYFINIIYFKKSNLFSELKKYNIFLRVAGPQHWHDKLAVEEFYDRIQRNFSVIIENAPEKNDLGNGY